MRQTLVKADLHVQVGRHRLSIVDQNERLLIRLPDEEPLADVLLSVLGSISVGNLQTALRLVHRMDLSLEVRRKNRTLVAIGRDVGSRGWTLLGVPRGRYRASFLFQLLVAKLRRQH